MTENFSTVIIILITLSNLYFCRSNLQYMRENSKLVIENMKAKGELWMLRKTVEKAVPDLLEFHDQATLEAQAMVLANEGVGK